MGENSKKPDIYIYTDALKYLKDYRNYRKSQDAGFTNGYICYELGQKNSKSYFNNVISGRVRIGPSILDRFRDLLELDKEEFNYFRNLVNYSQARTPQERENLFIQLLKTSKLKGKKLTTKFQSYYNEWYHPVVRALTDLVNFDGSNFDELSDRMCSPLSLSSLKKSISILIELGLISKNDSGYYKPVDAVISNGNEIEQEILIRFQEKVLAHSRNVLMDKKVEPQKVTTMTLSVSKKAYEEIEKRITELKHEIRSIANNDDSDAEELCQLAIHLYPYTRRS